VVIGFLSPDFVVECGEITSAAGGVTSLRDGQPV
jgi:hypothetical protein